jgi:hypothetical protein
MASAVISTSEGYMMREFWAWEWARRNGLWTPQMERSARAALDSIGIGPRAASGAPSATTVWKPGAGPKCRAS